MTHREQQLGTEWNLADGKSITHWDTNVRISEETLANVINCRVSLENVNQGNKPVYGVSTGFGHLENTWISPNKQSQLQINLIRSHAIGTGDLIPKRITRTAMILLANSLAKAHSGIHPNTLKLIMEMINHHIIPITYSIGSLGASGDLAPLAHVALCLIGEGRVLYEDKEYNTMDIFNRLNLSPVILQAKEGLALINGTHFITAYILHSLFSSVRSLEHSLIASALSVEALHGSTTPFDERISDIRRQQGQMKIAEYMRNLLEGSLIIKSHKDSLHRTQDAYALRCIPQVVGAIWDSISYLGSITCLEINAVTDNPIIFPETNEIISGGNFHAEPLALPIELASMAIIELANITEARIARLVSPQSEGLPAFLAHEPGIESGYMIAHYTAAALVNKMRSLALPAVTDNIPVSGNQEDHVSMGMNSVTKLWKLLSLVEEVIAFELLLTSRALQMVERKSTSELLESIIGKINSIIPFIAEDHEIRPLHQKMIQLIRSEELNQMVPFFPIQLR